MFHHKLFLLLIICSSVLSCPLVIDHTLNLTYQGILTDGVEQFLNIRFGRDTSGARRFKHPSPFYYESGWVVNATTVGPACPQDRTPSFAGFKPFSNISEVSEDCLNLRIARPKNTTADAKLPVMVWIYGGGDELGQAYDSLYNPSALVLSAASKGLPVIYVAMNYRLNVFGFANNPALAAEGSLNSGLLDQRLALEWVQDNIAHFGGDASSVTLFGESDGATGIGLQMTAYGGRGVAPFQRVILQSGSASSDSGVFGNGTARSTELIATSTNCTSISAELVLACLRRLPMPVLLEATLQLEDITNPQTSPDAFYPVVDGNFIPAAPSALLRTGRFYKNIPAIVGWNYDDGSVFATPSTTDTKAYILGQWPSVNGISISTLLELYPISHFTARAWALNVAPEYLQSANILRDITYTCPGVDFAYQVGRQGSATYLYELNQTAYANQFKALGASYLGVSHLSDIPFVFNDAGSLENQDSIKALASQMSGSWVNFAASSFPSPNWPAAFDDFWPESPSKFNLNVFGGPNAGVAVVGEASGVQSRDTLVQRCRFINSPAFYAQIQT